MAYLIFPDGKRYELVANQTSAHVVAGHKRLKGTLAGDGDILHKAFEEADIKLETDKGKTLSIIVMTTDGANYTYELA